MLFVDALEKLIPMSQTVIMTSQIALFNNHGVALASDTVLTVPAGNSYKTTQNCEKIRELGADHLVVLVSSGNSTVNDVALEVILSAWLRSLPGPLPTVQDYVTCFHEWIRDSASDYLLIPKENHFISRVLRQVLSEDLPSFIKQLSEDSETDNGTQDLLSIAIEQCASWYSDRPKFVGSSDIEINEIVQTNLDGSIENQILKYVEKLPGVQEQLAEVKSLLALSLGSLEFQRSTTIAFVGFGAEEHFPKSVKYELYGFGKNYVAATMKDPHPSAPVAAYAAFAQSDAILGFLGGAHKDVLDAVYACLDSAVEELPDDEESKDRIHSAISQSILSGVAKTREEKFFDPLFTSIGGMPMLTLTDFASSLVEMQATFSAATSDGGATVGGFIESLFITREHGVKWIRRLPRL